MRYVLCRWIAQRVRHVCSRDLSWAQSGEGRLSLLGGKRQGVDSAQTIGFNICANRLSIGCELEGVRFLAISPEGP